MDNDVPIELEDEEGAEIDSEVFPLFLGQSSIPNVVLLFQIRGEVSSQSEHIHPTCSQAVFYGKRSINCLDLNNELRFLLKILIANYLIHLVNNSSPSSTSFSPIVVPSGDQEVDNYKQVGHSQNPISKNLIVL